MAGDNLALTAHDHPVLPSRALERRKLESPPIKSDDALLLTLSLCESPTRQ